MEDLAETLARRSAERSLAGRRAAYSDEIRKILDAAYRVIQRTGAFDPTLREVLREAGASTEAFYKHFRSKDELLMLLLDDGRRQLLGYLSHRMDKASTPAGRVRAWIEGVMAQASDPGAAARTRPFLSNRDRLAELYPTEQQTSVDVLIDLLAGAIASLRGRTRDRHAPRAHAQAIYDVTFGALHRYLTHGKMPSKAEVDRLVRFSLNAIGAKG